MRNNQITFLIMNRFITLIITLCLLTPAMMTAGDSNKDLAKALKKERAQKVKELKKGGWELFGSTRTLDVALARHYDKLNSLDENGYELVGIASNFKSKNVGKQMAANNACITYAQLAGSTVEGAVASDIAANGSDSTGEFDHFYAAYKRSVQKEIRNDMSESLSLIRQLPDGSYEMQVFYIINEEGASKARLRALENAAKETAMAQEHAEKIAEFVKQNVNRE